MSQGDMQYLALLAEMAHLHKKKAAGYSGDNSDTWTNFREAQQWGVAPALGVLVRMGDKYRRLQNIVANPNNEQAEESVIDTAMDLAAYALIFICLRLEKDDVADATVRAGSPSPDTQGARRKG